MPLRELKIKSPLPTPVNPKKWVPMTAEEGEAVFLKATDRSKSALERFGALAELTQECLMIQARDIALRIKSLQHARATARIHTALNGKPSKGVRLEGLAGKRKRVEATSMTRIDGDVNG